MDKKKKEESTYFHEFLDVLGEVPESVRCEEPPDFIITLNQKKIAVELTAFHSDSKPKGGSARRTAEETWKLLQKTIMKRVAECKDLEETYGKLFFKKSLLPLKSKHSEFTGELVKICVQMISSGSREAKPDSKYPLLDEYVRKITLEEVGCYMTWGWNFDASFVGLSEPELVNTITPKIKKIAMYKKKPFDELWLLIISGHLLSQAMGGSKDFSSTLHSFRRLNHLLEKSGFDRVYIYQRMHDTVYKWPGWLRIERKRSRESGH